MSDPKFVLRNRESGEMVKTFGDITFGFNIGNRFRAHAWFAENESGDETIADSDTHDLIPVGYVPAEAVKRLIENLNHPTDQMLSPVGLKSLILLSLDQLAKEYGGGGVSELAKPVRRQASNRERGAICHKTKE